MQQVARPVGSEWLRRVEYICACDGIIVLLSTYSKETRVEWKSKMKDPSSGHGLNDKSLW